MKLLPLYSKYKGNSFETPAMEKHETIWNDFQNGGLKNVDISRKICSLQRFWVKKLYGQKSHDLKLIPMHFINNAFGKNFIFHSNLSFKTSVLHQLPTFLRKHSSITEKKLFSRLISLTLLVV